MKSKQILSNIAIFSMLLVLSIITLSMDTNYIATSNTNQVVYYGNQNSNKVSIMFNVYWGTEYLDGILDTLNRYGVKTTFFVGGQWVEKETEYLTKIIDNGHEIGNHGYFHKDHDQLSRQQNYDEIYTTHQLVQQLGGVSMTLFAPPSGAYSTTTIEVAEQLGYKTIMWSKDTIDWRDQDSDLIYTRATKNCKGGDLILAHPTAKTLEALPKILQYYLDHNLQATTVTQCITI